MFRSFSFDRRRRSAARIGGLSLHAQGDSEAIAARARRGLERKFVDQALSVDPTLEGERLERKVATIKRLFYARLGRISAEKRRARIKRQISQAPVPLSPSLSDPSAGREETGS